jgi:c(7)-type cytochrome triheme protein
MTRRTRIVTVALVALAFGVACVATAQTLPRLPQDFVFPQGDGSPGKVTFSHASHVDAKRPACTSCHPALFRILQPGTPTGGGAVGHAAMDAQRQCGACHNDKTTFGLGQCDLCHRGQ